MAQFTYPKIVRMLFETLNHIALERDFMSAKRDEACKKAEELKEKLTRECEEYKNKYNSLFASFNNKINTEVSIVTDKVIYIYFNTRYK
jgi:hypothetical protein